MTGNPPFLIKICGVRLESDVEAVGQAGGDAVGLNFYPPSARYVDPSESLTSRLSALAANSGLVRVGVFVNESADSICRIVDQVGLEWVQLHGDEPVETAGNLRQLGIQVIRAIKIPPGNIARTELSARTESASEDSDLLPADTIQTRVGPWAEAADALLLDADGGAMHGGSGQQLDWAALNTWDRNTERHLPDPSESKLSVRRHWTLAGGLLPGNVSEAIRVSGAQSVDVASGVESARGVKCPKLIAQFTKAALAALA